MVLNKHRKRADGIISPIAERFADSEPNTITWLSLIPAFLAGLFIFTGTDYLLPLASVMILCNAFLDALDGKIARISGKTSKRGDFLDHTLDRYADLFILGGIMFSPYCDFRIGFLAVVGVFLTSYMGTQAQALCARRDYRGMLGRADRLVLLFIIPLIQFVFSFFFSGKLFWFTPIEYMMLWFALAGNITAIQRGRSAWKELSKEL